MFNLKISSTAGVDQGPVIFLLLCIYFECVQCSPWSVLFLLRIKQIHEAGCESSQFVYTHWGKNDT